MQNLNHAAHAHARTCSSSAHVGVQAAIQAGVLDKVMPMLWSEEGLELTACLMLLHVLVAKLPQEQAELRLQAMLGAGFIIRIFTILQQVCCCCCCCGVDA